MTTYCIYIVILIIPKQNIYAGTSKYTKVIFDELRQKLDFYRLLQYSERYSTTTYDIKYSCRHSKECNIVFKLKKNSKKLKTKKPF